MLVDKTLISKAEIPHISSFKKRNTELYMWGLYQIKNYTTFKHKLCHLYKKLIYIRKLFTVIEHHLLGGTGELKWGQSIIKYTYSYKIRCWHSSSKFRVRTGCNAVQIKSIHSVKLTAVLEKLHEIRSTWMSKLS